MADESKMTDGPVAAGAGSSAPAGDRVKLKKWNAVALWSFGDGAQHPVARSFVFVYFLGSFHRLVPPRPSLFSLSSLDCCILRNCGYGPPKVALSTFYGRGVGTGQGCVRRLGISFVPILSCAAALLLLSLSRL